MDKQALDVLTKLEKALNNSRKPTHPFVEMAMKIATGVSTVAIIALFGLFTVQIPALRSSIERLTWQQTQMQERLNEFKQFTNQPRFTKDDFMMEMRLYDNRIKLVENELIKRTNFMDKTSERLQQLEKDLYVQYPNPKKKVE
jgi:hypothetical protein